MLIGTASLGVRHSSATSKPIIGSSKRIARGIFKAFSLWISVDLCGQKIFCSDATKPFYQEDLRQK